MDKNYAGVGRFKLQDSDVIESRIVRSTVTELPLPINDGDAVSLEYLRNVIVVNTYQLISLTSTDWKDVQGMPLFGNRQITINNTVDGGPNACWRVCRSSSSSDVSSLTLPFSNKINNSLPMLEWRWLPYSNLQIRKNVADYDGVYEVSINR